ncbi:ciliogenesis-associated TTC17-interacting protein [Lampris incognitus]|uniref:ciliogenesis-associated TTC17-interacting protein n=1 Tax=Lampris incognitus TaxID=2546036 RepID=UPI0024B4F2A0|nr:ciliogenesis-associated TTC17-interacting protein [Lampris incognitus]
MEIPSEGETAVVPAAEAEEPRIDKSTVSDEAIKFLFSVELGELQKCLFSDSLVTVSEGGRELGEFTVTVEFALRGQQPCLLLRASSQGTIDDTPCGTTVTAYLSTYLETLELDCHEFLKLQHHRLQRRCHMVQQDGQMIINKVTTIGEQETKDTISYPMSVLRGLVTEGSNLLLMRILALRKKVPENINFITFDQELHITRTTYSELGPKKMEVGCEMIEVFGVERTVDSLEEIPASWQSYFLPDGHLASRVQVGSPATMRLLRLPAELENDDDKPVFVRRPLVWEEDMQMRSKFLDRKAELEADHASYLRQDPHLRALMADFMQFMLLKKPDDIFRFAREYFLPFSSRRHPGPSL